MQMDKSSAEARASHLFVAGFNHARVPLRLRERYSLDAAGRARLLAEVRHCAPVRELAVVNTCNRFEIYAVSDRLHWSAREQVGHILRMIWPDMLREDFEALVGASYWREGDACARHLFRTASSLDSMVVGEAEINGQIKAAYFVAHQAGATGPVLNRLFQNAFSAAKRVRTETGIARGHVSVGTVAVDLALRQAGTPVERAVVCGAGRMAVTIARHLRKFHAGALQVLNRTAAHAEQLAAEVRGDALALDHLAGALARADVVIAAAAVPGHLITADALRTARLTAANGRPLIIVDVCLPRTVDPEVRGLPGVCLFDLDDLQRRVAEAERCRQSELVAAERVVGECVDEYWPRLRFALGLGECPPVRRRRHAELMQG